MYSGLLWHDDFCHEEHVYTFSRKSDFEDMNNLSIDTSIAFLEFYVWPFRKGWCIYQFILQDPPYSRATEKKLRHSVQYWKRNKDRLIGLPLMLRTVPRKYRVKHIIDNVKQFL